MGQKKKGSQLWRCRTSAETSLLLSRLCLTLTHFLEVKIGAFDQHIPESHAISRLRLRSLCFLLEVDKMEERQVSAWIENSAALQGSLARQIDSLCWSHHWRLHKNNYCLTNITSANGKMPLGWVIMSGSLRSTTSFPQRASEFHPLRLCFPSAEHWTHIMFDLMSLICLPAILHNLAAKNPPLFFPLLEQLWSFSCLLCPKALLAQIATSLCPCVCCKAICMCVI